jgi:hypothetical protein
MKKIGASQGVGKAKRAPKQRKAEALAQAERAREPSEIELVQFAREIGINLRPPEIVPYTPDEIEIRAKGVTYFDDRRAEIGPKSWLPYGFQFRSEEGQRLTLAERNGWRAAAMSEAMGAWGTAQEAIRRGEAEYRHNMKVESLRNDRTLSEDAACDALGVKRRETLHARLRLAGYNPTKFPDAYPSKAVEDARQHWKQKERTRKAKEKQARTSTK